MNYACIPKSLTTLTHHDAKFAWTSSHLPCIQHPQNCIVRSTYPLLSRQPSKHHIVYTNDSDNPCAPQIVSRTWWSETFSCIPLIHIYSHPIEMEHQRNRKAYGVYYAVPKWNYYLQGSDIIVCNDHKPLQKFLNGINANNKVWRWSLELVTYNIMFEWILGTCNRVADCLPWLVDVKNTPEIPTALIQYVRYIYTQIVPATSIGSKTW